MRKYLLTKAGFDAVPTHDRGRVGGENASIRD
jgi:hypothetical protein